MTEEAAARVKRIGRSMVVGGVTAALLLLVIAVGVWIWSAMETRFESAFSLVLVIVVLSIVVGYFASFSSSVFGFLTRCKEELKILFPTPADEDDLLRDTRRTRDAFLSIALLGVGAMFVYALQWKPEGFARIFGGSLMLALASIAAGICLGFLFGIPRTLQGDRPSPPPAPASDNAVGATPSTSSQATAAHLGVNTNLEQISDWLTKIIVGLGLINLEKLPGKIRSLITQVAPAVGGDFGVALSIVSGYAVCGFMLGYLLTRLYLARAFVRADRAQETAASIRRELDRVGAEAAVTPMASAGNAETDPISPEQKVAAARVERLAEKSGTEELRLQVAALAREYERVRASMPPGDRRTKQMEIIASKMRALSLACYELLPDLIRGETGERLAAVSFLEVKPSPDYLDWLVNRMAEEKPFIMYHAAWALRHAARVLTPVDLPKVQSAIERALGAAGTTDRGTSSVLNAALEEVQKRRAEN